MRGMKWFHLKFTRRTMIMCPWIKLKYDRLHQTFKPLDVKDNGSIQVQRSLAVSTAVELLKLVFLSMPTAPGMPNLLEDTLRRYSEQDLFTAYNYLRDRKFLSVYA